QRLDHGAFAERDTVRQAEAAARADLDEFRIGPGALTEPDRNAFAAHPAPAREIEAWRVLAAADVGKAHDAVAAFPLMRRSRAHRRHFAGKLVAHDRP